MVTYIVATSIPHSYLTLVMLASYSQFLVFGKKANVNYALLTALELLD